MIYDQVFLVNFISLSIRPYTAKWIKMIRENRQCYNFLNERITPATYFGLAALL